MQLSGWISVLLVIVLVVHVSVAHVTGRRYGGRSGGIRQKVRGGGRGGGSGSAYGGTRESFDGTRDSFDGTRDSFDGTRDSFDGTRVTFDGTRDSFDGRSSGFGGSSTVKDSSVNTGRGYSSSNRGDGISTYSKGTGRGSIARSSTFKSAIAGAAAGYITYQAGKAIINTAGAAMMWRGRPYYWGPSYYQYRSSYEMCSISLINSTDDLFSNVFFSNMTRPTQIVWSCRAFYDSCCGYECCPRNNSGVIYWIIIGIIVGGIVLPICCGYYILRRSRVSQHSQPNYIQSYPTRPFPTQLYGSEAHPLQPQVPLDAPPPYDFKC